MTETYPWDEQGEIKPVDSAGCEHGTVERPARAAVTDEELFILTDPSVEGGYIESEHIVDLEKNR